MKKRLFAMLTIIVLVVAMLPTVAFASESTVTCTATGDVNDGEDTDGAHFDIGFNQADVDGWILDASDKITVIAKNDERISKIEFTVGKVDSGFMTSFLRSSNGGSFEENANVQQEQTVVLNFSSPSNSARLSCFKGKIQFSSAKIYYDESRTSFDFTCTPITRDNLKSVITDGNDIDQEGRIVYLIFFKEGELQYFVEPSTGEWQNSDYESIAVPDNFDDIDQVEECIMFCEDGVSYDIENFTGVTANGQIIELKEIFSMEQAASGYGFSEINEYGNANELDVTIAFDLNVKELEPQPSNNNPKTADRNNILPYGCVAVASILLLGLVIRKMRREQ